MSCEDGAVTEFHWSFSVNLNGDGTTMVPVPNPSTTSFSRPTAARADCLMTVTCGQGSDGVGCRFNTLMTAEDEQGSPVAGYGQTTNSKPISAACGASKAFAGSFGFTAEPHRRYTITATVNDTKYPPVPYGNSTRTIGMTS